MTIQIDPLALDQLASEAWIEAKRRLRLNQQPYVPYGECLNLYETEVDEVLISGSAGTGKALALDTLVPTPDGWRTMGNIRVGDRVFTPSGEPTRVVWTSGTMLDRPCYEMNLSDGTVIVADADHLWSVKTPTERSTRVQRRIGGRKRLVGRCVRPPIIRKTSEIAADLTRGKRLTHSIDNCQPVECEEKYLPVDPYTIGYWIGDGDSRGGQLTSADPGVAERVRSLGWIVDEGARRGRAIRYTVRGLTRRLRLLGLKNNKHVPDIYMWASVEQRLELLRGWMDADGYIDPRQGTCELVTIKENLAHDALALVSSLGIKATLKEKDAKIDGRFICKAYRICFTTDIQVFHLERKKKHTRKELRPTQHRRYIADAKQIDSVPVCCIQVEKQDGLFLVGESFVPTHNSRSCLEKIHYLMQKYDGARALIVRKTRASLTESALQTYEHWVLGHDHPIISSGASRRFRQNYIYPNGSEIIIGGMDNPTRIMSTEYDIVFIQEVIELTEDDWESLTTRLRNNVVPFQSMVADTNPGAPSHWIKQRCDQGMTELLESRHEDNPRLYDHASKEWTQEGLVYIARLDKLTGARKQRLRFGKWVQAEGVVYETYDPKIHLIDRHEVPKDARRFRVIDFGYTNPFVAQWWYADYDDRLYMYREIYHTQRTVKVHCETINKFKESIEQTICDHDAEDRATLEENGIPNIAANKTVSVGIQKVQERFVVADDGKPRIFIMRDSLVEQDQSLVDAKKPWCTEQEITDYVWKKDKEEPVKENDHGMDSARYLVAHMDMGDWFFA